MSNSCSLKLSPEWMTYMQSRGRKHYLPLEDVDGFAVDDEFATLLTDFAFETAVSGIIFEHVALQNRMAVLK